MSGSTEIISDTRRLVEIIFVLLTGVGKILFMDLFQLRLPFILISAIGWALYILIRAKQHPEILSYWGFRKDNLKESIRFIFPFGIFSLTIFIIIGYKNETINLSWHILPTLLLYPIWGTIQQFLVIGLFGGNLYDLKSYKISRIVIILVTAILFSIVHYPDGWLILGTFILAVLYGYTYLRIRNIFALGLFHGWLGAFFYFTVVNRDPFQEVFHQFLT
jgi:uncharacterized protein